MRSQTPQHQNKALKPQVNENLDRRQPRSLKAVDKPGQTETRYYQEDDEYYPISKLSSRFNNPLLMALKSSVVDDIDLRVYLAETEKARVVSVSLIDSKGKFLFLNKLAREHFEGSLNNNLNSLTLFDLMIPQSYHKAHRLFSVPFSEKVFKYIIYSKNIKRKYLKVATGQSNSNNYLSDVYFRYLKSLTSRIRPVSVSLGGALQSQWHDLPQQGQVDCYLLETRLSVKHESLGLQILDDPIIRRYEEHAAKKRLLEFREQAETKTRENNRDHNEEFLSSLLS